MADNIPPAPNTGPLPRLPASSATGRLSQTTRVPIKKAGAGKIVVMLSSVAKPPPVNTQALPRVASPSDPSPPDASRPVSRPPLLPPKQVSPGNSAPPSRLSTTTHVKLPPKTNVPTWSSLSGKPVAPPVDKDSPVSKVSAPPVPVKGPEPIRSEPKKSGAQHIPPIKLNEPSVQADFSGESIFLQPGQPAPASKPEIPKSLEPAELNSSSGSLQSLEVFEQSQLGLGKPAPEAAQPEAKEKPAPLVAPPLLPPQRAVTAQPVAGEVQPVRPPPPLTLPVAKPPESSTPPPPALQVAPPMLEKAPDLPAEKLPPPNLPVDARKGETSPDLPETPVVLKVPALIQTAALSPKPLLPQTSPVTKKAGNWLKKLAPFKKSTPVVVSSASPKAEMPKIVEAKPALKPAVLPVRTLPIPLEAEGTASSPPVETPKAPEAAKTPEKSDATVSAVPTVLVVKPPETTPSVQPLPDVPVIPKTKAPVPLTRAERAKKRRFMETVVFWAVLVPLTVLVLFIGSLHFGRDTRVEGQVIPLPGTTLNNEVWIVNDFSSLVSGIVDELAQKRASALQEIQFPQDHVQRAQADVAAREERIRLLQGEIAASKAEIDSLVKQSRDAIQQVWEVDGAQIDDEYTSRLNQLQKDIAGRAKSLNLKYQSDSNFESPEVWANAYRLALYEVPAGVDTVKEHQWLGDLMKQWRDYLKTLDDRKEQLRDKAAQIKLAPASRITDLNSKIDDLNQRIDGTEAEEAPLKAELQQAQADLAAAQADEAGLDDEYYKQLYVLPEESIVNRIRIPVAANGRFTWVDDDVFAEGEKKHSYWIFSRATRPDGRQYWALHHFSISQNTLVEMYIEPTGFISTKAILRPDLSPEEQEQ